jgi:hypothetical protein
MSRMRLVSYLAALKAVARKDYYLTWPHISDKGAVKGIKGYAFRENCVSAIDFSEAKRLKTERVPHSIQSTADMDNQRIGTDKLAHDIPDRFYGVVFYQFFYKKVADNFGIGITDKNTAFTLKFILELSGINKVPIMGNCNCSSFEIQDKGLAVFDF